MSGENAQDSFSNDRAELFEALGHPTRIKILELLANSPMGFSDLKKALGIDSSGQLQFHLGKLNGLVKITSEGCYELSDEGREALRIVAVKGNDRPASSNRREIRVFQIIMIAIIIALAFSVYFDYSLQNSNHQQMLALNGLNESYNECIQQYETLLNKSFSGGLVADLSNSSEFKLASLQLGAKYFAIDPISGYIHDYSQVNGYIWDKNGTFISYYQATIEPSTFQVKDILLYNTIFQLNDWQIPKMSDYVIYLIQGAQ